MNRSKVNIIIGRVALLLLVASVFVLLVSGVHTQENKKCSGVDIVIGASEKKGFVNRKDINDIIAQSLDAKPTGTLIKTFNLRRTEKALEENVWIKKAQLFFDNNYVLHVQVTERVPVVRIIDNAGASYYWDSTGFTLPLSMNEHADVPVFTSVPVKRNAKLQDAILNIASAVNQDSFWLAQAAQINWLPANKFEIYPAMGNHVIDFGDASNAADKLLRLKLFYQHVSVHKGFDAYPKLSVVYGRQVLAVKPDSAGNRIDVQKAVQVFDQIVSSNRQLADESAAGNDNDKKKNTRSTEPDVNVATYHPPDSKEDKKADNTSNTSSQPKAVMPKRKSN